MRVLRSPALASDRSTRILMLGGGMLRLFKSSGTLHPHRVHWGGWVLITRACAIRIDGCCLDGNSEAGGQVIEWTRNSSVAGTQGM